MTTLQTPAFLLQQRALGESDRLLVFYTQHAGKLRGIAKGAQKSLRRFGGALDLFHLVKLSYKPSRGSDLCLFEGVELIRRSERLALNLQAFAYGNYFLELVRELTRDHHIDEPVFDLLHAALFRLDAYGVNAAAEIDALARWFELHLLDFLGYRPSLEAGSLPADVLHGLQTLQKLQAPPQAWPEISLGELRRAGRFLSDLIAEHCARPLQSARFLQTL